ncbi:hypothetical protein CEXT_510581, partial [Caerostris extrusa]
MVCRPKGPKPSLSEFFWNLMIQKPMVLVHTFLVTI